MPIIWSRQDYVQGFDYESITFKKTVNMFGHMEIADYIYEGVVEPSHKKPIHADSNRAGHSRYKRVEAASSLTCPEKGESASKRRKLLVDSPTGK